MKATRALKLLAPWILLDHKKLRPREKGTCRRRRRPPGCRITCRRPHHSLNICRRSLAEEQERGVLDFNIPLWPQIESMPRIPRRQRPPSRPIISSGAAINPATDRMHSHSNLAARRPRPGHYLLLGALTPQPPSERATGAISRFHAAPPRISMHTQKKSCLCVAPRHNTHALFAAAGAFKERRRQTSKFKDQALVRVRITRHGDAAAPRMKNWGPFAFAARVTSWAHDVSLSRSEFYLCATLV
jgi:hypothetical protein